MTRLLLASASPARLSVLRNAGIDPVVRVSHVDEDAVMAVLDPETPPSDVVTVLARAKAQAVADELTAGLSEVCWLGSADAFDCVVVGCDSMLLIDGELQGKPGTADVVRQRWAQMAGRSGELLTGHAVLRLRDGQVVGRAEGTCATTVHFGSPSVDELEAYIASEEPQHVAGAFTLDGRGAWFVRGIEGDPASVIGIGLPLVRDLLSRLDVSIAQIWRGNHLSPTRELT